MPFKAIYNPEDKTAARSLDTIYQNTSGKTILCLISLLIAHTDGAGMPYVEARVANSTPPATVWGRFGIYDALLTVTPTARGQLIFFVPDQYYYRAFRVNSAGNTITLEYWIETQIAPNIVG
jgi:hypothetical protein